MSRATPLRVLCWDHPRCVEPLRAAVDTWQRTQPDRPGVTWEARPLAAFNDQPVSELAAQWDLLFIDHPAVGDCAAAESLRPLDELLDPDVITDWEQDSVGLSHASYVLDGHVWALAVDAACQTSVHRPDLMAALAETAPVRWGDLLDLARRRPGRVAWPLYPTDAVLSLLSMTANLYGWAGDLGCVPADRLIAAEAAQALTELLPYLHPASLEGNPPAVLTLMTTSDEIIYSPLLFCYAQYQHPNAQPRLAFGPPPTFGAAGGAVLGGAGLAVSAASPRPEEAAQFAAWFASADVQRAVVPRHGGQPGRASAWHDPAADTAAGGFFSSVLPVIQAASLRPRWAGWPRRQAAAGAAAANACKSGLPAPDLAHAVSQALTDPCWSCV